MMDEEIKKAIKYISQVKKLEELEKEKEFLENQIFKNKHGFDKKKLKELQRYFTRD